MLQPEGSHLWESDAFVGTDHNQHQQPFIAPDLQHAWVEQPRTKCIALHLHAMPRHSCSTGFTRALDPALLGASTVILRLVEAAPDSTTQLRVLFRTNIRWYVAQTTTRLACYGHSLVGLFYRPAIVWLSAKGRPLDLSLRPSAVWGEHLVIPHSTS